MTIFSHYPLQAAIYQALSSDSALAALVTGVYDRPPQSTAFPYMTIGESSGSDWSTKTTSGMEQQLAIHVWSQNGGRKEAAAIMTRIHTLLHQANLSVSGQTLVLLRFVSSDIVLEDDGYTYCGSMRFRALLEAV